MQEGVNSPGSWIELSQLHRTQSRKLGGVTVDIAGTVVELPDVELASGETFVIGTADVDGADLTAAFSLAGTPSITIEQGGEVVHQVDTDAGWPFGPGSSVSRDPEVADGRSAWCLTWEAGEAGGDFATPGVLNGPCLCSLPFDFEYRHVADPGLNLRGSEVIELQSDGVFVLPGETGTVERSADASGQSIEWTYTTGIVYRGTRGFGTVDFVDQPIEIPPAITDYTSGTWSAQPRAGESQLCR